MPMRLEGSCHCGAVRFTCESHTPQPYQRCYCSICRKTGGGGGYAINIMAMNASMEVADPEKAIAVYRATLDGDEGAPVTSPGERSFCSRCGSALWLWDPRWPDLIHPMASVVDTALPAPAATAHILLDSKASWVTPQVGPKDVCFESYPQESIEDWHKARGLWID